MRRAVSYCLTRNLYRDVIPSLKSLIANTPVDTVYMLIEDDGLPYDVPDCVRCVNVSDQTFFRKDGPNYNSRWTWMVMMRVALAKILTQEDRVLSLDADTLILRDLSPLWDIDLSGYYFAGVRETKISGETRRLYINNGVAMQNLAKLRDGTADRLITALNNTPYAFKEQDCINVLCQGQILELPSKYNATMFTAPVPNEEVAVRHFAGVLQWAAREDVKEWMGREWTKN